MSSKQRFLVLLLLISAVSGVQAGQPEPWVPPPAPRVIDGEAIVPVAEVFDESRYILHLPKPEQGDWRQTRYEVDLTRSDELPLSVTMSVTPFTKDDEVVFFTIPKGSAAKFRLEVVDTSNYPFRRVWSGTLDSIQVMER